jgi:bifunctional UDP-N-acetylglucosamine pyrophosphorylase/glucosamine-1-phosphate N-acetyltransferase
LVQHVADTAAAVHARRIVVVTGNGAAEVEDALTRWAAGSGVAVPVFVRQEPQLGTGHAVQQAVPVLPDDGTTLILNGDVPLIQASTLQSLIDRCAGRALALLSVQMNDPNGYGRILRSGEKVLALSNTRMLRTSSAGSGGLYRTMAVPN